MAKDRDRTVYRDKQTKEWVNKRIDADRVSSRHNKQSNAIDEASRMLRNQGGGELTVMGRDGLIRSKDTIAPGNEPRSIKDREH